MLPAGFAAALEARGITTVATHAEANAPPLEERLRLLALRAGETPVVAVHPWPRLLDLARLAETLDAEVEPTPEYDPLQTIASGCRVVVDSAVGTGDWAYLSTTQTGLLARVAAADLPALWGPGALSGPIARSTDALAPTPTLRAQPAGEAERQLRREIEALRELPAMPEVAHHILQLRLEPNAKGRDLARLVELDPSLSAQVMRWARSPYYGYRGNIDSVHAAITRVLGFDVVMNLALGIVVGRSFTLPRSGPLGLRATWHQGVYCSTLSGLLAQALNRPTLRPGLASLAALFHNFGRVLLGHAQPQRFRSVNHAAAANRHLPVHLIERDLLGLEDPALGAWLAAAWGLPEEVVTAVRWHHRPDYHGAHQPYVALLTVANQLLAGAGLGERPELRAPDRLIYDLGLSRAHIDEALNRTRRALRDLGGLLAEH